MARTERSIVIGTAGHIDHGKTTLVQALTGTNTDRLPEEQRRGITIELGFAPWEVGPGLHASIVDVPGHEAFVRTMVAGAGGIDLLLLVVSAEDGVMPQTREHLHVCELLGVEHAVIALTKSDTMDDPDMLDLVKEEVSAELEPSRYAGSPIVPCSALTGAGLDELQRVVRKRASQLARRDASGGAILPLDRVFSMRGHGTVVTGTLLAGTLDPDSPSVCVPGGPDRVVKPVRIRGIQVRGSAVKRVRAGSRVALNLGGAPVESLARGDVLTTFDRVRRTDVAHAWLRHLAHDDSSWDDASLQVCLGTTNVTARLDLLDGEVSPGSEGLVRIRFDQPVPAWWGQRVVLRALSDPGVHGAASHGQTVGGGRIVDPDPGRGRRQRQRWRALAAAMGSTDPAERAIALIRDAGVAGVSTDQVAFRAGIASVETALEGAGEVLQIAPGIWADPGALPELSRRAVETVDAFHDHHPMDPGMGRAALEASLGTRTSPALAALAVDRLVDASELLVVDGGAGLARPGRGVEAQTALPPEVERVLDAYVEAGATPPTLKDVQARTGMAAPAVLKAVTLLQRTDRLVRITDQLSMACEPHDALLAGVRSHLAEHGDIDVQALKGLAGLSRKYAVPFLEHLDRLGVTRRVGDRRVPGRGG